MAQGNYEGISVREAMERINAMNNGWFLPIIQRQYVWGSRDSSEEYICLLLDSLLRGYPIGGLVLWETESAIPYREFLKDYKIGAVTHIVAEGRWGAHKFLVYDGQQRLQTLYSVLYHRFNGRKLYFNLLFDAKNSEVDETGFYFKSSNEESKKLELEIAELSSCSISNKYAMRRKLLASVELSDQEKELAETNFDNLWDVFVGTDKKSIAYFPVRSNTPEEVNEVFRRLNTGGMQLTQLEMVLAKIKEHSPYFEEELWDLSHEIEKATGGTPGIVFSAHEIVQLLYLMRFDTTRVDESKVTTPSAEAPIFQRLLNAAKEVLPNFFKLFFYEGLHINAKWLIIRQQAILPMLAYCMALHEKSFKWKLEQINTKPFFTYFIKSQLCDWNTQTMVTAFSRLAKQMAYQNKPFPLFEITQIAHDKNRMTEITYSQFCGQLWFALKMLTPGRTYLFNERTPQIDHIFPKALRKGTPDAESYKQKVDIIWNMQPTPAGINRQKWDEDPVQYFKSDKGKPFLSSYDFLPESLESKEWENEDSFIAFRKGKMESFLQERYGISLQKDPE